MNNSRLIYCAKFIFIAATMFCAIFMISAVPRAPESDAGATSVFFVNPYSNSNSHWSNLSDCMKDAALEFDVSLTQMQANGNQGKMISLMSEICQTLTAGQYVILTDYKNTTGKMLEMANAKGLNTLIINDVPRDFDDSKMPATYLGALLPDYKGSAEKMTTQLIDNAIANGAKNIVVMLIVKHTMARSAAEMVDGATNIAKRRGITLLKERYLPDNSDILAYLQREINQDATPIVLCYNSYAVEQTLNYAQQTGRKPGKEIYIAAFQFTNENIYNLEAGNIQLLAGGSQLAAGWAIGLISEHKNGNYRPTSATEMLYNLQVIDKSEINEIRTCNNTAFKQAITKAKHGNQYYFTIP